MKQPDDSLESPGIKTGDARRIRKVKLKILVQVTFLLLLSACIAQAGNTPAKKSAEQVVQAPEQCCPCCPPCIYPLRFVADMGYLRLSDPADYGFGRIGAEYALNQRLSFLGMIGGAVKSDGSDGEDAWLIDLMMQYNVLFLRVGDVWNPVFLGFGFGGWMSDGDDDIESEDSDIDIIAQVGAQIFGHPDTFNTSVFLEARSGVDEFSDLSKYGRFGIGLRLRF